MPNEIYRRGRSALKSLAKDRKWLHWRGVIDALAEARREAFEAAGTNLPVGAAYNAAFGAILKREKLGASVLDSTSRNHSLQVGENLPAIEAFRAGLPKPRPNHPSTVLRAWRRSLAPVKQQAEKPPLEPAGPAYDWGIDIGPALSELMNAISARYASKPGQLPAMYNPHDNMSEPVLLKGAPGVTFEDSCDVVVNAKAKHGEIIGYAHGVKVTIHVEPMRIAVARISIGCSPFELDGAPEDGNPPPSLATYLANGGSDVFGATAAEHEAARAAQRVAERAAKASRAKARSKQRRSADDFRADMKQKRQPE